MQVKVLTETLGFVCVEGGGVWVCAGGVCVMFISI